MPLTIAFGIGTAVILFTELGFWEAALIAAILAPTDASLGQAVISNPRVPRKIRQGLNVESGLNDGVVLPLVLVFLGAAEESATNGSIGGVLSFIGEEVLIAVVVGIAIGWTGAKAILAASRHGLMSSMWTQIGVLALAVAAYGLATPLHGSGFIAAWLTGLIVGALTRGHLDEPAELSETLGAALTMLSFLVFGAILLGPAIDELTWQVALYAVLSLALIRMVPVAIGMIGSGLGRPSVLFLGWFGPRGLASIIFAGIVIEDSDLPGIATILAVVMITVGLSVFAHGATSWFGSESYADWCHTTEQADPGIPEAAEGPERPIPGRHDPRASWRMAPSRGGFHHRRQRDPGGCHLAPIFDQMLVDATVTTDGPLFGCRAFLGPMRGTRGASSKPRTPPVRIVSSNAFAEEKLKTMRAFGAELKLAHSVHGIHPRADWPDGGAGGGVRCRS